MLFVVFEAKIGPVKRDPPLSGDAMLLYQANALAGEAGEVCDAVKKIVRDGASDAAVLDECGDVLFYMRRLLALRGYSIEDAAEALLLKLERQRRELAEETPAGVEPPPRPFTW